MTLLLLLTACTGEPSGDTADTADTADTGTPGTVPDVTTFADLQRQILVPRCGSSGCHNEATAAGNLILEGDDAYRTLTEDPCDNEEAEAAGLLRVFPGEPQESFVYLKMTEPDGMGDVMPPWGSLMPSEVTEVARWIEDGAVP